jgi:hypothetical protein
MILYQSIISLIVGLIAGIIYGSSFVLQQRGFLISKAVPINEATRLLLFVTRIAILAICFYYLLRSPVIPSILFGIAFVAIFWTIIVVTIKARSYE